MGKWVTHQLSVGFGSNDPVTRANKKELAVRQALWGVILAEHGFSNRDEPQLRGCVVQCGFKLGARRYTLEPFYDLTILE